MRISLSWMLPRNAIFGQRSIYDARLEVLTAVMLYNQFFIDVTPSGQVNICRISKDRNVIILGANTLKIVIFVWLEETPEQQFLVQLITCSIRKSCVKNDWKLLFMKIIFFFRHIYLISILWNNQNCSYLKQPIQNIRFTQYRRFSQPKSPGP
jgi:hypothetical protein